MFKEPTMQISYPADWRDIPPERWARLRMTPEKYTAMRAERLDRLSPEGKRSGQTFRLSETRGRPVGLVFGSYT